MIIYVAIISLIILGTLSLALAFLARRTDRPEATERAQPRSSDSDETGNPEDLVKFRRLIDDDAPHLLEHLSHWRLRMEGQRLELLAAEYIESSTMLARNEVLALFMEFYGLDETNGSIETALDHVLEQIEQIESERKDNVAALMQEIRDTSPVQLSLWSFLRDFLEVSEVKAIKLKSRIDSLALVTSPPAREGIEYEMSVLLGNLNTLKDQLSKNLPPSWMKEKGRRLKSLNKSRQCLHEWARTCPVFAASALAALPEGLLVRRLAAKLSSNLNDSVKLSGGKKQEPDWPGLPNVTDVEGLASLGKRKSTASVFMMLVALLLYGVAGLLAFKPARFDVDRALLNIVEIETPQATGTGFFISQGGLIVSNYHVVKGFDQVTVKVKRRGKPSAPPQNLTAEVVGHSSEEDDVAVLRLSDSVSVDDLPQGLPLESTASFKPGQRVHVLGNPMGLQNVYTAGIVSKVEKDLAFMDVKIGPGSSGGPVCDDHGFVIGVTTASAQFRSANLSFGIAIPATRVWQLINRIEKDHPR